MARNASWVVVAVAAVAGAAAATFLLREADPGTAPTVPPPASQPPPSQPQPETTKPPPAKAGFLQGRVRSKSTGQAIRGARVSLGASTDQGNQGFSELHAETGPDGTFEVPEPAGTLVALNVAAPGHVEGRWTFGRGGPDSLSLSGPWELSLITGRTIRGTVLDGQGSPIPEARVQVAQFSGSGAVSMGHGTAVRPDGTFDHPGVRPGPALVKASAPGWIQEGLPAAPEMLFATKAPLPASCSVVVPEQGEATIAITMRRGGTVSGVVVDHEGRPQGGKRLTLFGHGPMPSSTLTRPDGTFAFHGVVGAKGISVSASPGRPKDSDPRFDVPDGGSVEGLRVTLPHASSVHGVVVDPAGNAVEGAKVNVLPGGAGMHWQCAPDGGPGPSATTGADGSFRVANLLDEANQVVLVRHEGYAGGAHELLGLQPGEDRGPLRISLTPDSPVRGVVVDDGGRAVAGARVSAVEVWSPGSPPEYQIRAAASGMVGAEADGEGRFEIRGLAAVPRVVSAAAPGFLMVAVTVDGPETRIVLPRPLELEGVVRDAGTGRGIAGARVSANILDYSKGASWAKAETDGEGRFRLERLRPGAHQVSVDAPGSWLPVPVARAEAGVKHVAFDLRRGYPIAGRVLDMEGRPLENGHMGVYGAEGKNDGSCQYGPDGQFRFPALPPGRYRITANPTGWQRGKKESGVLLPAEVRDVEAGNENVEIRLARGVSLRGKVVDETGKAESLALSIGVLPSGTTDRGEKDLRWGKADRDGSFVITGLDPRTAWDLVLKGRAAGVGSVLRGVHAGQDDVVLALDPGRTITGRVLDEGGAPISGIQLVARALDARGVEDGIRAEAWSKRPWVETLDVRPRPVESEESKRMQLGEFVLKGLGRFRYRVTARTGRTDWAPATLEATAGSAEPIEFRLRRGATIEGRVSGKWEGRLLVYADPADGNQDGISYTSVKDDGSFEIRGLAPGPHRLRMNFHSSKEGARVSGPFDAPATGVELRWE